MKSALWIGVGLVVAVALVLGGLTAGWAIWGRHLWTGSAFAMGPGMMSWGGGAAGQCVGPACVGGPVGSGGTNSSASALSIEDAHETVEAYLDRSRYSDLEISELMEFQYNFYAIVVESRTGIGAMELLVDKSTGDVRPEQGPNMMWNARYGMHRGGGMMRRSSETNTISPEEAVSIAQRWLDDNRTGVFAEDHADAFYGYYTIHTLKDDQIEGMLSVHGATGQVWYHTWHGEFIQMVGEAGEH